MLDYEIPERLGSLTFIVERLDPPELVRNHDRCHIVVGMESPGFIHRQSEGLAHFAC